MRLPPPKKAPLRRPGLRLEALEARDVPALIGLDTADLNLAATGFSEQGPDIAMRPDGQEFVVTFESDAAGSVDIYAQRYNANWQPLGALLAVNTFTSNIQSHASVGMDGSGNFVVTWRSLNQVSGSSDLDIYARRYLANGTAIDSAEFLVNTGQTVGIQDEPDVAVNASGQFVITWFGGPVFFEEDILAKGYSGITVGGSGTPTVAFTEMLVSDPANSTVPFNSDQINPAVAMDAAGNFVVAYQSFNQIGGASNTYSPIVRRMNANGTTNGAEVQVNGSAAGGSTDVAMDGSGNYVVTWGQTTDIFMQRYDSSGVAQGSNTQVNTGITTGSQSNPHVAAKPVTNGDFVVTWEGEESDGDGLGSDVYYKTFNSVGTVLIGDTLINTGATAVDDKTQANAVVAINTAGDFVVADESGSGATFDIVLRRFGEDADIAFTAATSQASEASNATISLTRNGAAYVRANVANSVTVNVAGGGSATAGTDFTNGPYTVNFPADGSTTQNLTFNVSNDTTDEADETINLSLGSVTNGTATGQTTHTYTIQDNDPPPSISVSSPSVTEGNAGTVSLTFTISLTAASGFVVTGNYATADGTATAGSDYVAVGSTAFNIPAGATSITRTVTVNGDATFENNETLTVNLSGVTNTSNATASGTGTITNDDTAPTVSVNSPSVTENDSGPQTLTFTISIPAVSSVAVTGNYATANVSATAGPDYGALSSTPFTIPAGMTSTTVDVTVNGDTLFEGNETLALNLSGVTGTNNPTASGTGTITDDDAAASITVSSGNNQSTIVSTNFASPLVALVRNANNNAVQGVTVTFTGPGAGATFNPSPTAVTTNASGLASTGTITANAIAGGPYSVSAVATGGTNPSTNFSLTNLPASSFSINDVTATEGTGGTTTFTFTVTLSPLSSLTTTVNYATANGSAATPGDYTATSGTLSFAPGETTQTISVTVVGDTLNETNETFFVNLSGATNAGISDNQGVGTITNDDPVPSLSIDDVTQNEGAGGTTAYTFTVTLSPSSGQTVMVDFATADGTAVAGSDYTATSGTLTFTPGQTTKTVTVLVNGDTVFEANQTFFVNLTAPSNATIADPQGLGTITNDDAAPTLAINDVNASEAVGTMTFTVTRTGATEVPIAVDYATADVSAVSTAAGPGTPDFTATSGTLNFTPSLAATATQTITVSISDDNVYEAVKQFFVDLSNATGATFADARGLATIANDDAPPSISIGDVSVSEATGSATFTVTLTGATALPIGVDYTTANGTAVSTAGGPGTPDYTTTTGTLTFNPSASTTQTLTITVSLTDDTTNEATEQFVVNLSNPTNGSTIGDAQGVATITNDDPVPTVSVDSVTLAEGDSGTTAFTFTVTLSAASAQTITVDYQTADGTALAGSDYTATNGTLTFAPGVTTQTVTVLVTGDTVFEADQTFTLSLINGTNVAPGAQLDGAGTITNDDTAPTLAINDVTVSEAAGTLTFTVTRTGATEMPIAVDYATTDISASSATAGPGTPDFASASGTLNFAPSLAATATQTITVSITNDNVYEAIEQFFVDLSNATGATFADARGLGTISNDDAAPSLSIGDITILENGSATFTVTLTGATALPIGVDYTTADGTALALAAMTPGTPDYTTTTGTLTFNPSASATQTLTITVPLTNDTTNEAAEQFVVNLSNPTNGSTISDAQATATVTDDDPVPSITIDSPSIAEGNAGTTALTFTVNLNAASALPVTVAFATSDGTALAPSDYTPTSGTLTFAPGETSKTVTVLLAGDTTYENDETVLVTLSAPTNAIVTVPTGTGTATNDDPLPAVTLSLTGSPFSENGGVATVTATLANPSAFPVTVNLAFSGTASSGEYTASAASILIPAGSLSGFITLTGVDDAIDENDETVIVDVDAVTGGTEATPQQVIATETDDDLPVAAVDSYSTNEDVTLTVAATGVLGNDTFAPGSTAELVGLGTTNGLLTLNPNGSFTYAPTLNTNGPDSFQYRVRNAAGEVSAPVTVTLTITAVNDAPSFTKGPDQTLPRTSGAQTVTGWATAISAGPTDEAGQTLTFLVTNSNPGLFSVQPTIDAAGNLTYTPAANDYGTATVTVRLADTGGTANGGADTSAPQVFTITVMKHKTENRDVSQNEFPLVAVGAGAGGPGTVTVYNGDGSVAYAVSPFANGNGVRATIADVTGDGVADVIAATGPGAAAQVVVIDGVTKQVVKTFQPFGDSFTGGLYVAAGDVNGDGVADIAVSADFGGGPRVVVIDGASGQPIVSFLGIDDLAFRGGARVTFGDVNADGLSDLIVSAGFGGGPRIAVYDGASIRPGRAPARLVSDFFVFDPGLRDGAYVTAGDLNGDGFDDLIFGGGPGGGPRILALDGKSLFGTPGGQFVPLTNFFSDNPVLRSGVRVQAKDFDGDRKADLITAAPGNQSTKVAFFLGANLGPSGGPHTDLDLLPGLLTGLYVG